MLLEFRAANYKSFIDEFVFSLVPAPKQKDLDYSVMETRIGKRVYRGLCSAVLYGPNASGKTNIIGALDTFKSIVLRGNIRNDVNDSEPNVAAGILELIPNNLIDTSSPVEFSITFIEENLHIEYTFSMDIGIFMSTDYKRKIISETLKINHNLVFTRNEELEFGSLNMIHGYLVNNFEQNANSAIALSKSNLNDEELFLMNGFKTMFSSKLVALISDWLDKKFMVIYHVNSMRFIQKFSDFKKESIYIEKTLNEAANYFGINSNALGYIFDSDNDEAKLYSIFENNSITKAVPAEVFESYGTIRFVNMFPLVVNVLQNGGTLVVDEFDASIHPMALMSIINIFHNDDINTNHAQLVFNTHNPIFLNSNLFRRDEIKFVERDDVTHLSSLYSLSDFKTVGKTGVRKNEDYMKNYYVNRYGAIKDIDFSPVFETLSYNRNEE